MGRPTHPGIIYWLCLLQRLHEPVHHCEVCVWGLRLWEPHWIPWHWLNTTLHLRGRTWFGAADNATTVAFDLHNIYSTGGYLYGEEPKAIFQGQLELVQAVEYFGCVCNNGSLCPEIRLHSTHGWGGEKQHRWVREPTVEEAKKYK